MYVRVSNYLTHDLYSHTHTHTVCMSEVLTALPPSLLGKLAQDDRVPFLIKYAQLYQQCFHNDCKVIMQLHAHTYTHSHPLTLTHRALLV